MLSLKYSIIREIMFFLDVSVLVLSEGSAAHVIHPAATDKSNINKILALIIRCKITEYPPNVQNYTDSMFSKMGA